MSVRLIINECRVNATSGAAYLMTFRRRMEAMPGRVTILRASIGGDLFAVECESATHAGLLIDALSGLGNVPRSAMKVATRDAS